MIKYIKYILLIFILVPMLGCAPETSPHRETCITSNPSGFMDGIANGVGLPLSMFLSLLTDEVSIYSYDNNGAPYDIGFFLGIMTLVLFVYILTDFKTIKTNKIKNYEKGKDIFE